MISNDWQDFFAEQQRQSYFARLAAFVAKQRNEADAVFPAESDVYNAFRLTPVSSVKVVILGQDPYHGPSQAHGLSFSVPDGIKFPPSLRNVFKQLSLEDSDYQIPLSGDLSAWGKQGVLLLNTVLTVNQAMPNSHANQGWEVFSDNVIAHINSQCSGVVFMLWGKYAQSKASLIDANKHCVLIAPHPSPLSAHRGFFGCNHFTLANCYLAQQGKGKIDWR